MGIFREAILDRFGRIVIPKKIREDFNIEPGTQIRIEENDKAIILKPIHDEPNLVLKDGVLVFFGTPMGNLKDALMRHRGNQTENYWSKK